MLDPPSPILSLTPVMLTLPGYPLIPSQRARKTRQDCAQSISIIRIINNSESRFRKTKRTFILKEIDIPQVSFCSLTSVV